MTVSLQCSAQEPKVKNDSKGAGEMAPWLGELAVPPEDPCQVAYSLLWFQLQGIQYLFLASMGTCTHMWQTHANTHKILRPVSGGACP